jgi:hypothetical protein
MTSSASGWLGHEPVEHDGRSELMLGARHPFTGAIYEKDPNGNVQVTDGDLVGLFAPNGRWLSGTLRECDPQLCGWVAGPIIANHRMVESAAPPPAG